ncbi:MAG TPA: adenylate/guanylate cyclase domain-containing protein [Methylomirabilota bacterium]|nr:adenylate/guanylate cyclase domain-containing protein [Methylomirabilota bacterium]
MLRSPLALKIGLLIVVVLIVGFGLSTILTIRREADLLVEQNKIAARRLTATLVASIEGAMLQERPDVTRTVIQELRENSPVDAFGVYRRTGVEAFTDLSTAMEVDRNAGLAPEVMKNIRKMARPPGKPLEGLLFQHALDTITRQEALESRDGVRYFTLLTPIRNQERCQGCHGADHAVRAVVRVATSMEPVFAEVARHRNRQLAIGLLTIAAAGAVLTVAMRRIVLRPVNALAATARRVGEGDFSARASEAARDELGQLGAAFNEMTSRLAQAYTDLETKNSELGTALQHLQESRQRLELLEQLKGELSKFVPEAVKRLLEQNPNATELEKKTVEVSVLFLDIAGYTKLSEQLEPRRLNQLVQTYFSSFLEIIQSHHGDINETAGDGLMVIFQSERGGADHALNATRAAFAIRQRTTGLNEEYGGVFPPVQLHMGINTGEALVGATKLGGAGAQRWTFTATGPTTNVAARFAGSAEGGEIVVGPTTSERIRQHFVLESLGERSFKNVSQPIRVYRVIPPGVYEKIV